MPDNNLELIERVLGQMFPKVLGMKLLEASQDRISAELIVTPDICSVVDELVWHFDEPFADSSAIPTYIVSKLAREHVR